MRSCTALISIALIFTLCACSTANQKTLPGLESQAALIAFTRDHGTISDPFVDEYLRYLGKRLASASVGISEFPLVLLDSNTPLALSSSSGLTAFSKGLVLSLSSESELAFVLAHELAHIELGHFTKNLEQVSAERRRMMEFEADSHALSILASAGYNSNAARLVLSRTRGFYEDSKFYPGVEERIENIEARLRQSFWAPSGTVDRRDFQKLRHFLQEHF